MREGARPVSEAVRLGPVRKGRAGLRAATLRVEAELAAPLHGREEEWATGVASALDSLAEAFAAHVALTEDPDGLFAQIRADAPHLDPVLRRLQAEHQTIGEALATQRRALADSGAAPGAAPGAALEVRDALTTVLGRLVRHRQQGADLVWRAYEVDLGGE